MASRIIEDQTAQYQRQRFLVVDDEPGIIFLLKTKLELAGFDVLTANNGRQALDIVEEHGLPHLAIVDIIMPKMDGITFCKRVREFSDLPIILLTSVEDEDTIVEAINSFAEDYVTKPFRPREVVARVKKVFSRYESQVFSPEVVTCIDERLSFDFTHQQVIVVDKIVKLTPTENKLMHIFYMHQGKVLPGEFLQRRIWPREAVIDGALRINIFRLRKKIEVDAKDPQYLQTIRGKGYRFQL